MRNILSMCFGLVVLGVCISDINVRADDKSERRVVGKFIEYRDVIVWKRSVLKNLVYKSHGDLQTILNMAEDECAKFIEHRYQGLEYYFGIHPNQVVGYQATGYKDEWAAHGQCDVAYIRR